MTRREIEQLADTIASLWIKYDLSFRDTPGEFEQLLWKTGGLIRTVTEGNLAADPDQLLHDLVLLLGQRHRHVRRAQFQDLAESVLLHRAYPNGPTKPWDHLKYLVRIDDDVVRSLYERESSYRNWSGVQLANFMLSGLFSEYRAPEPAWRLEASGKALSVTQTPHGLAIAWSEGRASGQEDVDGFIDLATYDVRVQEVDWRTGANWNLGPSQSRGEEALLVWASGTLWLSSVNGLLRNDDGIWRLVVPMDNWETATAPIQVADAIVTVCNSLDKDEFRLCVLNGGNICWSETFEGHASEGAATETAVIVRVVEKGKDGSWAAGRVARIGLQDLRENASVPVYGHRGLLLSHGNQLFSEDQMWMRVAEDIEYDMPQSGEPRDEKCRVIKIVARGEHIRNAISCFDPITLKRVRQWTIAEKPQSLLALPEGRGLLVTCGNAIQAIVPTHARPVVLARWTGAVVCEPIQIGTRLLWLVHRGSDYVIEICDYEKGTWSFVPLNLSQQLHSMQLCGETIILIGTRELLAFHAARLVDSALTDSQRRIEALKPFPEAVNVVSGLPLAGPVDQRWTDDVSPELARELLPPADLSVWTAAHDVNESFLIWQRRVTDDLTHVRHWPDFIGLASSICPPEFFTLTSAIALEDESSPPFGSLALDWSAIEQVLAWKRSIELRGLVGDTSDEALRRARALLYEYMIRCISGRSLEKIKSACGEEGIALVNSLQSGARDAASWLNIARVLPRVREGFGMRLMWLKALAKESAIVLSLAWAAAELLGKAVPHILTQLVRLGAISSITVLAAVWLVIIITHLIDRRRSGLGGLEDIWRSWPDGCPSLIENADAFVRFVQDCHKNGLLDWKSRTELQEAVARAWEQPVVNKGQMVFISYSHKQLELAHQVAEGLRSLGVGAILDRNELADSANDATVEMWIAENLMRSVTSVYLLSDDVRTSGWVHREGEWQLRVLGTKPNLVLPYIVAFGSSVESLRYPRCRTIEGSALIKRPTETLKHLAGRVVLDWLLALKARKLDQKFGIAYQGKRESIIESVILPIESIRKL